MLTHLHRWIWKDADRRAQKLLRFSETEIDGGRDILRAAELSSDPLLRRLYMLHASDENRHGQLFRRQASALLRTLSPRAGAGPSFAWGAPAGHGLDDLRVEDESDDTMLAFLHVAEKDAARRFTLYCDALQHDPSTRAIFEEILHDEKFHMNYTLTQLVRVSRDRRGDRHGAADDSVLHRRAGVCSLRQTRGAAGASRLARHRARAQRFDDEPVLT